MNRKLLRATLLGLIALAALFAAAPSLGKLLGIELTLKQQDGTSWASSSTGFCANSGIAVVVDFGEASKRSPTVSCVYGSDLTGWQALAASGHKVEGTAQYPIGFVCRIDGWPVASEQDCADTPLPAEGTWVYFYASSDLGESWLFSGQGAAARKPACGSVEGWRFVTAADAGKSREPSVSPKPISCR